MRVCSQQEVRDLVRRYGTAAPLPLHVPELAEGLGYEAAV